MLNHIGLSYPTISFSDDAWVQLAALYWDKSGAGQRADADKFARDDHSSMHNQGFTPVMRVRIKK
jgi:hypothetical protein